MRYFFIINPGSNHKRSGLFIPQLLKVLDKRRIDYRYSITSSLNDACSFSKEANQQKTDIIVAIGGDGTINQVINGFYDEHGNRTSTARLGVIHTGTSPDFCMSYGIPKQASQALNTLMKGFTREISVARIEYHMQNAEQKTGYFACCASFGMGAQVAQTSNSGIRKYLGDGMGTLSAILYSLCRYKPNDLCITADGKETVIRKNFNTFIGKTAYIASGMKVNHNLKDDDNRLYIISVKNLNPLNVVPALKAVYSGKPILNTDYIDFSYAKTVEINGDKTNNRIEYDGDPQGFLPCKISIATDNLELITDE